MRQINIDLAKNTFELNIKGVKEIQRIYDYLKNQENTDLDLSELLRAEIALVVSALDCFIHDIVKLGTIQIYSGERNFTPKVFQPEFETRKFINLLTKSKEKQIQELETAITGKNKTSAFQKSEMIAKALLTIGIENVWTTLAGKLGRTTAIEIKKELDVIIDRRNLIVHEGDIAPNGSKHSINELDVIKNVKFIHDLCFAIFEIINTN